MSEYTSELSDSLGYFFALAIILFFLGSFIYGYCTRAKPIKCNLNDTFDFISPLTGCADDVIPQEVFVHAEIEIKKKKPKVKKSQPRPKPKPKSKPKSKPQPKPEPQKPSHTPEFVEECATVLANLGSKISVARKDAKSFLMKNPQIVTVEAFITEIFKKQ